MNCFGEVGEKLEKWALQARGIRGVAIADITIDAIKDISKYFQLPDEFTNFIDEFRIREGALQSLVNYRDHFIHPFHVFCLGYVILKKWRNSGGQGLLDSIGQDENLALKTWFVTSIYHDVGYPSEKFEALVMEFFNTSVGRGIRSQFDWSSVLLANENIKHIDKLSNIFAQKINNNNQAKNFKKWFHKRLLEDHDHGVLTALMLLSQDKIPWGGNWDIAKEAALAIALHSWKRDADRTSEFDLGRLSVEDLPLAFFLSYCDTAQEWGRKVLLELMRRGYTLTTISNMPTLDSILRGLKVESNEIIVTIKYLSRADDIIVQNRADDIIVQNKTLTQVFQDVGKKFRSTWCLNNIGATRFFINGEDVDGFGIGGFGASPQCKK